VGRRGQKALAGTVEGAARISPLPVRDPEKNGQIPAFWNVLRKKCAPQPLMLKPVRLLGGQRYILDPPPISNIRGSADLDPIAPPPLQIRVQDAFPLRYW